jgi:hypothetical protein
MNRRVYLPVLLLSLLCVLACRETGQTPKGSTRTEAASLDPVQDSLRIDTLFEVLPVLQSNVEQHPGDSAIAAKLLAKSLDTVAGCLYVVGTGIWNAELPEDAQLRAQKMAAGVAADQWALYLKSMIDSSTGLFGIRISGKVLYKKELRVKTAGDSLYLLFQIPVGSVVVK